MGFRDETRPGSGVATMVACGSDGVTPPPPPLGGIDSVTVEPQSAALPIGDTLRLVAHVFGGNGAEIACTELDWSSSQDDIIAVSSSSLVTAQGEGAATISASASGTTGSALVYTNP